MIDWLGNTVIAAAVTGLGIAAMASPAKAADELEYLAMFNLDRAVCGLTVEQITVDRYISGAAIKYNASQEAVVNEAVQLSTIMRDHLRDSGRLKEYCQRRAQK